MAYAVIEETMQGRIASYSNSVSRYSTSGANRAAPSGAWKIAPIPPAAPASTRIRRSRAFSFSREAKADPNPDPICAMGPSFPADPPVPIVRAEARIFTNGTRFRIFPPAGGTPRSEPRDDPDTDRKKHEAELRREPGQLLRKPLPKALRSAFRHRRQLLPRRARCARKTVAAFVRDVTGETALPASIVAMQTSGDFLNWHPHLHVLASAGAFFPDGRFIPVPVFDVSVLRELFQAQVLALLVKERMVSTELIDRMKTWRHSGFHAFAGDEIPDTDARRRLHHEGVRRPQDPRPRRAEVRPAQAPRHADVVPVRRRRRCSLPRPAPFRRIRARPLSGLRTAVTRPENGLFRGDAGLHDTRRARGIRCLRNFREEYTDGEKMREQVSPGGMPVDPARVSRVGREITFRPVSYTH